MEVVIDGTIYIPKAKEKSELEVFKEKYASDNYICIKRFPSGWAMLVNSTFGDLLELYKLIHKKHESILDAYLLDSTVEIEYHNPNDYKHTWAELNFIEYYNEEYTYNLKPQVEYPIFKTTEGAVWKFTDKDTSHCVFSYDTEMINFKGNILSVNSPLWETVLHNKETGLYHKQPVWCQDTDGIASKTIRLHCITKHPNSTFSFSGTDIWESLEPITSKQLKTMPFIWDMYKQLKD